MGLKRKAIRNISIIALTQISGRLIRIFTTLILARILLPYDFGIIAIGMLIVETLQQFKDFGIGAAIIQKKDNVEEALNTAFTLRILLSIILFTMAVLLSPLLAIFYDESALTNVSRIVAIIILVGSISFAPETILTKNIKFKKIGAIELLRAISYSIIAISLAILGYSYWSLVFGSLISFLISAIALWFIAPFKIRFSFNKKVAKEIIRFGKYVFGANLIVFIIMNIDNAIIGKMISISVLGYYVIAYRWGLWSTYLPGIISRVTFPTYSRIQDEPKKLREGYLKTLEFVGILSFPFALGLCAVASIFVPIIVGEKWAPAVPALEVLCIFGLFSILVMIPAQVLLAIGKPSITYYTSIIRLLIMIIFIYPALVWKGIFGVALVVTISTFVQAILMNDNACKFIQISWSKLIQSIAPALIASLIMFLVLFLLKFLLPSTFLILIILFGLGILIYSVILYSITKGKIITNIREITSALKSK